MSHIDIIRAWKDAEYRRSLSPADRAALPENPAGAIELHDEELEEAAGGLPGIYTSGIRCKTTMSGQGCYTYANCSTEVLCGTYGACPTSGWCPSVKTKCIPV